MPSVRDVYNQLSTANSHLEGVQTRLTEIKESIDTGFGSTSEYLGVLSTNLNLLVNLQRNVSESLVYTNQALFQNSQENQTIICYLEKISRNMCSLLNESNMQTELQKSIQENSTIMLEIQKSIHPEAFLNYEKMQELQSDINRCCPEPEPEPVCRDESCDTPKPMSEPEVQENPTGPH